MQLARLTDRMRAAVAFFFAITAVIGLNGCSSGSSSAPAVMNYSVGGTVTGLASGQQVVLLDNGGDALTISANGAFTFAGLITANGSFLVTVGTQPTAQTCTVSNRAGSNMAANVSNVAVACSTDTYTISGTISGLDSNAQVTLLNNDADPLVVKAGANGFSFSTPVAYGSSYAVSVGTQPPAQSCSVSSAGGSNVTANVTNVAINCVAASETTLYSFGASANDASGFIRPGLMQASDGNFYGVSDSGGTNSDGTVFKVTPGGQESVLYSFTGSADGKYPVGPLVQGDDGSLYGVTSQGGSLGYGTIFKISTAGQLTTLHTFGTTTSDAQNPLAGLTLANGVFYGVTEIGGTHNDGAVFQITQDGVESVLYSFAGGTDGQSPNAPLLQASDGNLYGTTQFGGANSLGVAFRLTLSGTETVLHTFGASGDAASPFNAKLLQASDGNLYAVTESGGAYANGALYRITLDGAETVLYSFGAISNDVNSTTASLVLGSDGNLYGTSYLGGTNNLGTIYRFSLSGSETILYSFAGGTGDGSAPSPVLVLASDGYFYGLSGLGFGAAGGAYGSGTFFRY